MEKVSRQGARFIIMPVNFWSEMLEYDRILNDSVTIWEYEVMHNIHYFFFVESNFWLPTSYLTAEDNKYLILRLNFNGNVLHGYVCQLRVHILILFTHLPTYRTPCAVVNSRE